jgi:hypothetical protein
MQLPLPTKFQRRNKLVSAEASTPAKHPKALSSFSSNNSISNVSSNEYRKRYNKVIGQEIEDEISKAVSLIDQEEILRMHRIVFEESDNLFDVDRKTRHLGENE